MDLDFLKRHSDAIAVLTAIFGVFVWLNVQFSSMDRRLSELEKEIAVVKTVMIMRNIMPPDMAARD